MTPLAPSSPHVVVDDLTVMFQGRTKRTTAIENLRLVARRAEVIAIIGPSGSGKTTILNVIAGLVAPTLGSARIGGQTPEHYRKERGLGFCFQQPVLFDWRNVLENVLLPAEIRGVDLASATIRAKQLLDRVGIREFEKASPGELSGGMRQRASLCQALVLDPGLLLLDEPFSAVDALTRQSLWLDLRRLRALGGPTTCLVTHSVEEAAFLADRVYVLSRSPGSVQACIDINLGDDRSMQTLLTDAFHKVTVQLRQVLATP